MCRKLHNFKCNKKRELYEVEGTKERRWSQIVASYQYADVHQQ